MIIDTSYFVGEIHLSQVGSSASAKVNNNTLAQHFIDENEVEIMDYALGKKHSKELFDQLQIDGSIKETADAKWTSLVEGETYMSGDVEYYWRGLKEKVGKLNRSLIAYYVYYKYMTNGLTQRSTMGVIKADAENAKPASAIPTVTNAWRKMFEWYGSPVTKCYPTITQKRGGVIIDYLGAQESKNVSLYQYLNHKETDFPDVEHTVLYNRNQMGV